jgi:hypothetical protein
MKRFLLFAGSNYYPSGGWDDMAGQFDSITEAQDFIFSKDDEHRAKYQTTWPWVDWAHVVDLTDGTVTKLENERADRP